MDFGTGGIGLWVPFVPTYGGNRDAPPEARCSLEIRLMRPVDQMAMISETDETIFRWRKERLAPWLDDADMGPQIKRHGVDVLKVMRMLDDHTRNWTGFLFDGVEVTDPVELFLRLAIPRNIDLTPRMLELCEELNQAHVSDPLEALEWIADYQERVRNLAMAARVQEKSIAQEVREAIEGTAGLTGSELGNFVGSFSGNTSAINGGQTDGPTVPTAQPAADSGQEPADTSPARGADGSQP